MKKDRISIVMTTVLALCFGITQPATAQTVAQTPLFDINELKQNYIREKQPPFPASNPYTPEKELLGRTLFFDPRLSASNKTSCASCHQPDFDWADRRGKSLGDTQKELSRKTPSLLNIAWAEFLTWDGRATTLEEQSLDPIRSKDEMGLPVEEMIRRLKALNGYQDLFKKAFPHDTDPVNTKNVMMALATFERTLVSPDSPFDAWVQGDENAISQKAKRGFMLFNDKANCQSCHGTWRFTTDTFNDIGIKTKDKGRGKFDKSFAMQNAFKTMTLIGIARRSPYMHNASLKTLYEVINFYDNPVAVAPSKQGFKKGQEFTDNAFRQPLDLTEAEKQDLITFLETLSVPALKIDLPVLPKE